MFEVIHGHDGNGHWTMPVIDKVDEFACRSAFELAPRFIHTGWKIDFADTELITASFGQRWIQISRRLELF